MSRKLTESQKKQVAADQKFRCANKPNSNLKGIANYECPMWKLDGGNFDGSGYEIDHIIDHCISQDDSPENLQALCPSCHRRKTRNSAINKEIKILKKESMSIDLKKTKIIKKPTKKSKPITNKTKIKKIKSDSTIDKPKKQIFKFLKHPDGTIQMIYVCEDDGNFPEELLATSDDEIPLSELVANKKKIDK